MSNRATALGRGLGGELRDLREASGLTTRQVAAQLGWQASKVSRMETGKQGIQPHDLAALLVVYCVTGEERDRLLDLAERSGRRGWSETFEGGLTPWSKSLIHFESEASRIFSFEPLLIPGLLQTADYTRALMKACGVADTDAENRVAARLARQAILSRDRPPQLHVVLDEMALRRAVGGPRVMSRQLRHVAESAERPHITVQVVPFAAGAHTGLDGAFLILDFARHKPVVHLEHKLAGLFLEVPEQVKLFRREADRLMSIALNPPESVDFVARVAAEPQRA